jgi:dTDP-4-dehydrorhamnose reductase
MKVLIFGGAGMLGHKLWQAYRDRYETWVTLRGRAQDYAGGQLFDPARVIGGVEAFNFDTLVAAFAQTRPDVVINCIGIIKQLPSAADPIISLTINALLPHRLATLCRASGARLIHISTDCVFSGRKGGYTEADTADAEDLYGRTKFLGEVAAPGMLTLRTSIIGRELQTANGLVEWFLSQGQAGRSVHGYTRAIYSGFTTLELARIIGQVIDDASSLTGLYQVSSEPITKFDLLGLLRDAFKLTAAIEPDNSVAIDRSLDGRRFRQATGYMAPDWPAMIQELRQDVTPYRDWTTPHVS